MPNENAKKTLQEMLPGHVSPLAATDPELLEVFDNFAFDEVVSHGVLDARERLMVILASLIAQQTLSEYKIMLQAALNVGVTPSEVKEIVYQAVPYTGIAKVLDFLTATNEALEARGVKLPLTAQATTTPETRFDKGLALQKSLFGDVIDAMYENSPQSQLHIQRYLSGNCFGDYVSRSGLDKATREMLTFAILLSLGGCEPQLKGHINGNVSAGNTKEKLLAVVTHLVPFVGYPRALNALGCLNELLPEPKAE